MRSNEMLVLPPFAADDVQAAYLRHGEPVRGRLLQLRSLVFEAGRETNGAGEIVETLKWGQPAYLTERPKTGTTIRIDATGGPTDPSAVYFHCQSRMIPMIKEIYQDLFQFEGKRALVLPADKPLPTEALSHCMAMALTYHKTPK